MPPTANNSTTNGQQNSAKNYRGYPDDSLNNFSADNSGGMMNCSSTSSDKTGDPARKLKCVFVGDGAVGKTSLIVSYTTNGYPQEYVPTAFDNYSVLVRVDNHPVQLQLCDTAGQDDFDTLRPLCYPNSDVFLLCFSVVSPTSFYNLAQHWIPEIRTHAPYTPIILIGTQSDLRNNVRVQLGLSRYGESAISEDEAKDYTREIHALQYIECSALTQKNLKEVFDSAILAALNINNRQSRVFLQEVKSGPMKSLREQLRKLKRTNSVAEEHRENGAKIGLNNLHEAEACGNQAISARHPLAHCQSAVMLKRQLSTTRLNEVQTKRNGFVPLNGGISYANSLANSKPVQPPAQKMSKMKKGWKRLKECLVRN